MRSLLILIALLSLGLASAQPGARSAPAQRAAIAAPNAERASITAATRAGSRTVAVGDQGVVLLSDDGLNFRQAKQVPVQSTLTQVVFVDAQRGWATGHDGVILATRDGGETWTLQRWDAKGRQPLLGLWFADANTGYAVGQFGQVLHTADGGANWEPLELDIDEEHLDRHFNAIFGDAQGRLWILGEEGLVLRSTDRGGHWVTGGTGQPGSLWNGLRLQDGSLLAAGMRGHLWRSRDQGVSWSAIDAGVREPLTGLLQGTDGTVWVIGFGGTVLTSRDSGNSFKAEMRADRAPLSAIAAGSQDSKGPLLFATTGRIKE